MKPDINCRFTMCLRRISHTILQVSVLQVIFVALLIVFIRGITYPSSRYTYEIKTKIAIEKLLYEVRNPNLFLNVSLPKCDYSFINSSNTIEKEEVNTYVSRFKLDGIENGSYVPRDCNTAFSVALIAIYKYGKNQLPRFIPYMHNFMKNQNIHYKIFLVQQQEEGALQRGLLYNVGALAALREEYPCLIFHDMDMLPLDTANIYACTHLPRHVSGGVDDCKYDKAGGVLMMEASRFQEVNGFSNRPDLWLGDDFKLRLSAHVWPIVSSPPDMSNYVTLKLQPLEGEPPCPPPPVAPPRPPPPARDGLSTARLHSWSAETRRLYTLLTVRGNSTDGMVVENNNDTANVVS